jgi:hypothetical protein
LLPIEAVGQFQELGKSLLDGSEILLPVAAPHDLLLALEMINAGLVARPCSSRATLGGDGPFTFMMRARHAPQGVIPDSRDVQ